MNNKLLTISVAAYNMEKYIDNTLDSLVVDTSVIDKIEVIVVNDGSTDGTKDIVKEYVDKYPNTFKLINKENGGYGSTINESIKIASGKYYKLLDGDDWYDKQYLEQLVRLLEKKDVDMILTDYVENYENGSKIVKEYDIKENEIKTLECISFKILMHSIAYRTSILKNSDIRFDEHCLYTDSEFVVFPMFYVNNLIYYKLPVYQYRLGREGQSVEVASFVKHITDLETTTDSMISYYKVHEVKNNSNNAICINIALHYQTNVYAYLWGPICKNTLIKLINREKKVETANKVIYLLSSQGSKKIFLLRHKNYKNYWFEAMKIHLQL